MIALIAAVTLTQAPVALVQSSNFGVPPRRASELTDQLADLMSLGELTPKKAAKSCDTRACVIATAKDLGATTVISIGFAQVVKDTLVDVEALETRSEKSLGKATFKVPPAGDFVAKEVMPFLKFLTQKLPPAEGLKQMPKEDVIEPRKDIPPPQIDQPEPRPPEKKSGSSHVASYVLGGISAVVLGAGIVFGQLGNPYINKVYGPYHTDGHVPLSMSAAQANLDQGNMFYGIADVGFVLAGALCATAVLLFFLTQ